MSKKKKTMLALAIILGVAVVGLAAGVYAKYIASITGQGEATVARWAFSSDNVNKTVTCEPSKTYNPNTLVADKIAPGTTGTCTFHLSNENSDVGVNYTISLNNESKHPRNLVLDNGGSKTGTLAPGAETDVEIGWSWEYYTSDAKDLQDTADGIKAAGGTTNDADAVGEMSIKFDISGVQVEPVANQ